MTYIHHYVSPLGGITMASAGEALTGLWFAGQSGKKLSKMRDFTYNTETYDRSEFSQISVQAATSQ